MLLTRYENDFVKVVLEIAGSHGEVIIHGRIFSIRIGNSADDKAIPEVQDTFHLFDFDETTIEALESVSKDEDEFGIKQSETITVKRQPHTHLAKTNCNDLSSQICSYLEQKWSKMSFSLY